MAFEKFDLTGRTALITGAGGLLGIEHSTAILDSGGSVILTDIKEELLTLAYEKLANKYDEDRINIFKMDVTQLVEIKNIASKIETLRKRIDILINNAAIDSKVKKDQDLIEVSRLENISIEQWNREIEVGLTGAFLCSQVFGSAMAKEGIGGVILNISSDLSVISPDQRLYKISGRANDLQPVKPVTYSVIKTGLIGLTRYLATYWANQGVRCNALSPGGVYNGQGEDFIANLIKRIPIGRMAVVDEYRGAVQFLCSDASGYLNGQNIVIDGGRSIL